MGQAECGCLWRSLDTSAVLTAANCDHPLGVGIFLGELRSCKTGKGGSVDLGPTVQYAGQNGLKWPCSKKAFQRGVWLALQTLPTH